MKSPRRNKSRPPESFSKLKHSKALRAPESFSKLKYSKAASPPSVMVAGRRGRVLRWW